MKKHILFLLFGLFVSIVGNAQTDSTNLERNEELFILVEIMPEFQGGSDSLLKFISKTMIYPEFAKQNGIIGRVFVGFVIEKDGAITNVEILRGVEKSLNEEAIRIVKLMPKWRPGIQGAKAVRVKYTLPIVFKL